MLIIKNILALIGAATLVACAYMYLQYQPMMKLMSSIDMQKLSDLSGELDPKAAEIYGEMLNILALTKNAAEATVWKYPVEEDLTIEDVETSLKNIANEHNIKAVGELPLSKQVQLMTGEEQRFLKIYMFCNPMTAMKMVEFNDAFSAYLPCRISLIEDKKGKLWLYALNMDMMVWGGATLPEALLKEAKKVRFIIKDTMERAAQGDF